jgi:stalled ribosome alternative rescue factor ArfA
VYSKTGEGLEVPTAWIGPIDINAGWQHFKHVFSGGDGIIYAITTEGILKWYHHTGFENGAGTFEEPKDVGTGWNDFSQVFSAGAAVDGVLIYAVTENTLFRQRIGEVNANLHRAGELLWWKHKGYKTGSYDWEGAKKVGHGWENLSHLFAFLPGTIDVIH